MTRTLDDDIRQMLLRCSVPSVVSTLYRMGFQNVFLRDVRPLAPARRRWSAPP